MNVKLLKALAKNSNTEAADLAVMLGMTEEEVRAVIASGAAAVSTARSGLWELK